MCNQFQLPSLADIKKYLVSDLHLPLEKPSFDFPENCSVFPKGIAPVLLYQNDRLELVPKTWGYPSPFDQQKVVFNARIERFFEKKRSMWDSSFARSRCIIIANQFFESGRKTYSAANKHQYHERFAFHNPDEPLTLIAGIYQNDYFSMVTTKPNSVMAPVHDRMPLIIGPNELRQWLFQDFSSLVDRKQISLTAAKVPNRK